ncbi:MAG: hypothetical protein AAF655_04190 [Bacteroidota bacterium]
MAQSLVKNSSIEDMPSEEIDEQISSWKEERFERLSEEAKKRKGKLKKQLTRQLKSLKKELCFHEDLYDTDSVLCEKLRRELDNIKDQLDHLNGDIDTNRIQERVENDCKKWLATGCQKGASAREKAVSDSGSGQDRSLWMILLAVISLVFVWAMVA